MNSVSTILHPTDFSEPSRNAFELACDVAAQQNARVILLHAAVPLPAVAPMPYDVGVVEAEELSDEKFRAQLEELRSSKPNLTMEYVLERGDPSEVILQVAEEANCDAIIMGTHGRTGLSRLVMGSVAEAVVRNAPCPVITIKEPLDSKNSNPTDDSPLATN